MHHAKFMKWLCYVAIPGSRCQKNKSIAIGNAWIGRFSFLIQKQNALTIQHSITKKSYKNNSFLDMLLISGYVTHFWITIYIVIIYDYIKSKLCTGQVPNFACCPLDWRYTNLRYALRPPTQHSV